MWIRAAAIVDLEAVRYNLQSVKSLAGNRDIWPAVKANAYGHGAVEVSKALLFAGATGFCTATVPEALELRSAGITAPILVLGCIDPEEAQEAVRSDISLTLCSLDLAQRMEELADSVPEIKVHLKLDTGMGRIGLGKEALKDLAQRIACVPQISIEGVYTHFCSADASDCSFTLRQIAQISESVEELQALGIRPKYVHAANSAGILAVPEGYFNLVRPGIMIYGEYPSANVPKTVELRETFSLISRIAFIKTVPAGTGISYSRTHVTTAESRIATVPVGYGDGYPRALSNTGQVSVRGQLAPIVGRICMDQFMVDVTGIEGVQVGDEVVLYGRAVKSLTVGMVAESLGTISYELLCNINSRVPRIYINA